MRAARRGVRKEGDAPAGEMRNDCERVGRRCGGGTEKHSASRAAVTGERTDGRMDRWMDEWMVRMVRMASSGQNLPGGSAT